jgi:uncharacterized protein with PQ loop repeat
VFALPAVGGMTDLDLLGYVAGAHPCAFWPQVRNTWTTNSAGDQSLAMLAIFSTGVGLCFLCGIALSARPIILMNAVTLLLTSAILARKPRFQS